MNKIQIVRVLWGHNTELLKEIPKVPIFENEIVFVFGRNNYEYLIEIGYNCLLLSEDKTDIAYSTFLTHFGHKLEALKIAESMYDEYLFLDWDITISKPIDDDFYKIIRSGNDIQCPLYAYDKEYLIESEKYHKEKGQWSKDLQEFTIHHSDQLTKYSWDYNENLVIPCFCFFYSRKSKIIENLISIYNEMNILTCIEELCLFLYMNCDLDTYINKHEPIVLRGKEYNKELVGTHNSIISINNYIGSILEKDIYMLHDI